MISRGPHRNPPGVVSYARLWRAGRRHWHGRFRLDVLCFASIALLVACAPTNAPWDDALSTPRTDALEDGDGASTTQIVYVDFDGATISDCDEYCSDAPGDRSWAIGEHFGEDEVTFAPYEDPQGQALVVARLTATFAPYDVAITTTRPEDGPYTMVIISPTAGPNHGVAPLDCSNANQTDIAFVYNLYSSAKWSAPEQIARSAAHELGHSFGLEHVVSAKDVMHWASSGDAFTVSAYDNAHPSGGDCLVDGTQDAPAALLNALGSAH